MVFCTAVAHSLCLLDVSYSCYRNPNILSSNPGLLTILPVTFIFTCVLILPSNSSFQFHLHPPGPPMCWLWTLHISCTVSRFPVQRTVAPWAPTALVTRWGMWLPKHRTGRQGAPPDSVISSMFLTFLSLGSYTYKTRWSLRSLLALKLCLSFFTCKMKLTRRFYPIGLLG